MNSAIKKKVNWGIMGTGWIADRFASDLQYVDNGEAIAVGSRTLESATKFAENMNIPKAYGSYEELVADPNVDVIYIGTPHPFHIEHVTLALQAGKAVLCEKPFTVNANDLEKLIALARQKNVFMMEAMWTRFLPAIVKVREWIQQGQIGEVKQVRAEFGFHSEWNPQGRLLNPELGGGALLDAGIYPVSFAAMIFGANPIHISSSAEIGQTGVDEHFSALLDYGAGKAALVTGAVRLALNNDAYIYGTKGHIHIPTFLYANEATLQVNDAKAETFSAPRASHGYAYEAEEVGRLILAGEKECPIISLNESLNIIRILDKMRGQWGLKYPFE
ncbi:putative dehydrogenase [Paenibacillus turicensis]|uniref:Dehydrogenase n=1 Tax=Paenibacillus turicensis TaxID=160487 RepID=A0ABS4FM63_9BACL|nr:Gfo/Idh/MocA family oxidoreductase [Paenibacillus turicensis]MBP1903663.1 putative dehydrogenase [Paenibacillus turicensis]